MDREKLRSHDSIDVLVDLLTLDNTFKVNAALYAAKHASPADKPLEEKMLEAVKSMRKKSVVLAPWDADVTSYDVLHRAFGQPVESSERGERIQIHEFDPKMHLDSRGQLQIVKRLGQICGAVK